MKRLQLTLWTSFIFALTSFGQNFSNGMEDAMYSSGRINVVIGVIAIIFILFIAYLIRLDRKISKLEQDVKDL